MSNGLWDGVSDVSETEFEVSVDSGSDFPNIDVIASLLAATVLVLLEVILVRVLLVLMLLNLLVFVWNDISSRFLIVSVVGEEVVQFRVNDSFNDTSGMIPFFLQNCNNDFHNHWNHGWEPVEYFVDDLGCQIF